MPKSRGASADTRRRALNRATLARQMLLTREKVTPLVALSRLIGLQAQWPRPPFVGLWTRVTGFEREALARLLRERKVVRATTLRGTLHLMTAKDYLALRSALQPMLAHGALGLLKTRAKGVDVERLLAESHPLFAKKPRTFEEVRDALAKRHPRGDIRALAYLVRTHLPLVMVPQDLPWGYATASAFALAESWLGKPPRRGASLEPLALRYLAAFGPAAAADFSTWSGVPGPAAREAFATIAPKTTTVKDERGRELLDLPDAPRPGPDVAAPARFLPEFDNLVLGHADRRRFVADAHRPSVFLPGLRVAPTFLLDGFVAGTWAVEVKKDAATLAVQPFAALAKGDREALAKEGEALLSFLEPDARTRDVRFGKLVV